MKNHFSNLEEERTVLLHKKLEESEQMMRTMVMQSPSGICILHADTLFTEIVNDTFLEIAGKPRQLFEKETYWTIFEEVASTFEPILKNVIDSGIAYHTEEAPITLIRNGVPELLYVSFVYEPIKDSDGVVVKVMNCVIDVTSKVLSRKKTEKSEQNLRNTILQAPVAMAILKGPEHVVEIANNRMYELWGKPEQELYGKPIFQGLPEARNQGFETLLGNVYNTGESFSALEIPVNLPRDQGIETIYINMLYEPYREENDEITGIVAVASDVTEQIKSKQRIEESEAKYRTLFETMDQGFCIVEMIFNASNIPIDYRFLETNPVFEKQTGLKDAHSKTALQLIPNLETRWFEIYGNVALTGKSSRFIEGSEAMGRWFEVYAFRVGGNESKNVAILFTDISDRKKAEIKLREREHQLQFTLEAAELATWDFNPITNKFTADARYCEWFGISVENEETDNNLALRVIAEEDRERVIVAYTKALDFSKKSKYDIIYTIRPKDRPERILRAKGKAWFNENNIAYRFTGTLEDLTSEIKSKKELTRAKELSFKKFEKIANTLPQIVWTATSDGNLDYFNDQWFSYSGLSFEQSVGQGWASTIHPDDLPGLAETWANSLQTGVPYEVEARIRSIDNVYNWALIRAMPVKDDNTISQWCGTCTLIQDHKESEQKLKNLSNELAAANEEILASNNDLIAVNNQLIRVNSDMDNFIYTASHDLKAPISNIEGLVTALARYLSIESAENPMIIKLLTLIHSSIERFKKTLSDLTEITKLQRLDDDEEKLNNLNEMIEDIKLDLSVIIDESSGTVTLDLDEFEELKYSPKNLRSIFYNLISNSLKYRSPDRDPLILITGREDQHFYVITIKDNCLGMDLSNKNSIFGMFKRLHNHVEGSGIGLFIVKKIIDNAGGKIEVESKIGEGSIFSLYFKKK